MSSKCHLLSSDLILSLEESNLGAYCLQYKLPKNISRDERTDGKNCEGLVIDLVKSLNKHAVYISFKKVWKFISLIF